MDCPDFWPATTCCWDLLRGCDPTLMSGCEAFILAADSSGLGDTTEDLCDMPSSPASSLSLSSSAARLYCSICVFILNSRTSRFSRSLSPFCMRIVERIVSICTCTTSWCALPSISYKSMRFFSSTPNSTSQRCMLFFYWSKAMKRSMRVDMALLSRICCCKRSQRGAWSIGGWTSSTWYMKKSSSSAALS